MNIFACGTIHPRPNNCLFILDQIIMLIDLIYLKNKYNLNIRGVIHIGAHECEELPIYQKIGLTTENIIWFEANPQLVNNIIRHDPQTIIYAYAVTDSSDKVISLNVTNNFQSSSILNLKKHADYYPSIVVSNVIDVPTIKMADFFIRHKFNPRDYNMLNMDIQGAELHALKGFESILKEFDVIYTEINTAELYEGCCTVQELDDYLSQYDFERVETSMTDKEWGDALYLKKKKKEIIKVANHISGGIGNQLFQFANLLAYCKRFGYQPIFDPYHSGPFHSSDIIWEQFEQLQMSVPKAKLEKYHRYDEDETVYHPIPSTNNNLLIFGHFNSERYFADYKTEIIKLFQQCFIKYIVDPIPAVGIHVRRGDYLNLSHVFKILQVNYYEKAIALFEKNKLVVVSEDLEWCKENIKADEYYCKTTYEDFGYLMSFKNGLIIANSTFSWWASYLNPHRPKIVFPLEWFNNSKMQNFQRYYVAGWRGITLKENSDIVGTFHKLLKSNNHEAHIFILSLLTDNFQLPNISSQDQIQCFATLINLSEVQKVRYQAGKRIIKLAIDNLVQVDKNMREKVGQVLGSDAVLTIDLKKIPIYIICAENRRVEMKKRFNQLGLTPIFVNHIKSITSVHGCGLAHYNAVKLAYEKDVFPFAIFEDDVKFTENFQSKIIVPRICDAFYLGLSRWGVIDGRYDGVRNSINVTLDVNNCYHIKNMLSAHGIVYINKKWTEECLQYIDWCNKLYIPHDIGMARLMQTSNVLSFAKPIVIQDPIFNIDNVETIVEMADFL